MDVKQIICQATGRTMKAERVYKIKNEEDCLESVVSICHTCPYANGKKNAECTKCHGTIVQNTLRKINEETGRAKTTAVNYRNFYIQTEEGDYVDVMNADDFLQILEDNDMYIANLNNSTWSVAQKGTRHKLPACDRPATWKTDCYKCKSRCHAEGKMTACEKAKQFMIDNGVNVDNAPSDRITDVKLPIECICTQQTQRIFYI